MLILLTWGGAEFGETCFYNACTLPKVLSHNPIMYFYWDGPPIQSNERGMVGLKYDYSFVWELITQANRNHVTAAS